MADALLEIVIGNLEKLVKNELATVWGVDSQIQELSENFTAIQALLHDAEEKQTKSNVVKNWLQRLSDAAHVLEDILEEYSMESSRRLQSEGCLTRFHPMPIFFRRNIGKKAKEMVERFRRIEDERRRFGVDVGFTQDQQDDDEWRQTSSEITEPRTYGRDQDREKIVEFLSRHASSNNELSVYPIVGMAGLGKTKLAQCVFNDDRAIKHFDLKIWVCVSTEFNITRILQSIVESITGKKTELSTLKEMQKEVQNVLLGKKYLLVLDDVWNEEQEKWEKLKCALQCGSRTSGVSILVTTRNGSVASMVGTCPAHQLSPLEEEDSWSLFKHYAFGPNNEEREELVAIGKDIVKKCAGSPLASKALGSLLRNKNEEKQWLCVKESKLWDVLEDDAIMRALKISYFNLKLSLRRCFSFCAIYPEDFRISKEELIHLWMANGLIKSRRTLEVEDVGNQVWEQLRQRSFFQEVKIDRLGNTTFKIHDLFCELARSIMGDECNVSTSKSLKGLSRRIHHVTFSEFYKPSSSDTGAFKKVESLRTFIELKPRECNFSGLPPFKSLRLLRTSSSQLSALKALTHLRYLNICKSCITTLPKCVSRLQKLQFLKLENCPFLSSLPKHLTQLKDLRHLLIERCQSLVAMPPNIGELKCLKTLNLFIVHLEVGFGLAELRDLQLGGKLHIKGLENVHSERDARDANLMSKKELSCLYFSWDSNSNSKCTKAERILEALEPSWSHSNLKSFGMKGYRGSQFPNWMGNTSNLSSLVHVILYDCKNCERLPPLGKLPHLTYLFVCGMKDVKYLDDDSYDGMGEKAFKSLKELTLKKLPNMERILRDEGVEMLPLLSTLKVSGVPKLKLPLLSSVEHLEIEGDFDLDGNKDVSSFLEAILQNVHHVKELFIKDFPKLKVLPHDLGNLSLLKQLVIFDCDELESFPEDVLQSLCSLQDLIINDCKQFKSLSEGMGHLTCLERLQIANCPKLVTLPSNMNQLTALHHITISHGIPSQILPDGLQRIPSIHHLNLYNLPLESLPEWLGDLTSLQGISMDSCYNLRSLPSSFQHLTNLRHLRIERCPKLEKRCKRVTGEDWQNIAHIPQLQLFTLQEGEEIFCGKIRHRWNMRKITRYEEDCCLALLDKEFDRIIGFLDSKTT